METLRERILRLHAAGSLTDVQLHNALAKGLVQAADVTVVKPVAVANRETIKAQAAAAMDVNRTFIARGTANTTAQVRDQTVAQSRQLNGIIRLLLNQLDGTN